MLVRFQCGVTLRWTIIDLIAERPQYICMLIMPSKSIWKISNNQGHFFFYKNQKSFSWNQSNYHQRFLVIIFLFKSRVVVSHSASLNQSQGFYIVFFLFLPGKTLSLKGTSLSYSMLISTYYFSLLLFLVFYFILLLCWAWEIGNFFKF